MEAQAESELPTLAFASAAEWDAWLEAAPRSAKGAWLTFAKKASGLTGLSKQDAIDVALCHGWIDGQLARFDDRRWLVRFTPRKPKSKWSAINRDRATALIDQDRMRPAGFEEVERAKADGRWEAAYASQGKAVVPDDLLAALAANPEAQRMFSGLDGANRYAILHRINDAKRPETRTRRIETYVAMLARGETLHPRTGRS